jgi:dephospho-CoA kinase
MIIGISGTFSSGKDTLAAHLAEEFSVPVVSTGDIVRREALKQFNSIERPVLHEVASVLRQSYGGGILVERALLEKEESGVIITGIRSMGEAKKVIEQAGIMIFIDAPIEVRYERMKQRNRDQETTISLQEFIAREDAERTSGDGDEDFNIDAIEKIAQVKLINLKDQDALFSEADMKLKELI